MRCLSPLPSPLCPPYSWHRKPRVQVMLLHMMVGQTPGWLQVWREIELSVKPRLTLLQTRRSVRQQRGAPSSPRGSRGVRYGEVQGMGHHKIDKDARQLVAHHSSVASISRPAVAFLETERCSCSFSRFYGLSMCRTGEDHVVVVGLLLCRTCVKRIARNTCTIIFPRTHSPSRAASTILFAFRSRVHMTRAVKRCRDCSDNNSNTSPLTPNRVPIRAAVPDTPTGLALPLVSQQRRLDLLPVVQYRQQPQPQALRQRERRRRRRPHQHQHVSHLRPFLLLVLLFQRVIPAGCGG